MTIKHRYRVSLSARFTVEQDAIGQILAENLAHAMTEYLFQMNFPHARELQIDIVDARIVIPPKPERS